MYQKKKNFFSNKNCDYCFYKKILVRNFLSVCAEDSIILTLFWKNFVKATFLLKSLFHEIFFQLKNFVFFTSHCVKINEIYILSHFLGKKFVKSTLLLIKNVELIWQKKISLRVNFAFFHTVSRRATVWKFTNFCLTLENQKWKIFQTWIAKSDF